MSNIARFNAVNDRTRDAFAREDSFQGAVSSLLFRKQESQPEMKICVTEDEKIYSVDVAIPGAKKDEIKVEIGDHRVSIGARIQKEKEERENGVVIGCARYFIRLSRRIALSQSINKAKARATYADGRVLLTLPKSRLAGARAECFLTGGT